MNKQIKQIYATLKDIEANNIDKDTKTETRFEMLNTDTEDQIIVELYRTTDRNGLKTVKHTYAYLEGKNLLLIFSEEMTAENYHKNKKVRIEMNIKNFKTLEIQHDRHTLNGIEICLEGGN